MTIPEELKEVPKKPEVLFSFDDFEPSPVSDVVLENVENPINAALEVENFYSKLTLVENFIRSLDDAQNDRIPTAVQSLISHNLYALEDEVAVLKEIKGIINKV